jgi:hypothetical protein
MSSTTSVFGVFPRLIREWSSAGQAAAAGGCCGAGQNQSGAVRRDDPFREVPWGRSQAHRRLDSQAGVGTVGMVPL